MNNNTIRITKKNFIIYGCLALILYMGYRSVFYYIGIKEEYTIAVKIGVSLLSAFLESIKMIVIYLAIVVALSIYDKRKLDESDFNKSKDMYRDIIKNYSIGLLNYIDSFGLDYVQSYTAKLLELQKNKIIDIRDNNIYVIGNPVNEGDIEFINSIRDNKVTLPISRYEDIVAKEGVEKGLLMPNSKSIAGKYFGMSFSSLVIGILITVVLVIFIISAFMSGNEVLIGFTPLCIVVIVLLSIGQTFLQVYIYTYIFKDLSDSHKYLRTSKGKDINSKLEGLKVFMKEFGNVSEKESKSLVLWDDYLLYSVMFNQNKGVLEEYSKYLSLQ